MHNCIYCRHKCQIYIRTVYMYILSRHLKKRFPSPLIFLLYSSFFCGSEFIWTNNDWYVGLTGQQDSAWCKKYHFVTNYHDITEVFSAYRQFCHSRHQRRTLDKCQTLVQTMSCWDQTVWHHAPCSAAVVLCSKQTASTDQHKMPKSISLI